MAATLVIAGDLCAVGRVGTALSDSTARRVWSEISRITEAADFAIVNLECPLTGSPEPMLKSGLRLWGPPEAAPGIRAAGFTAVSLANNHILDAGPAGLIQTLQACRSAGLACVGAGADHTSATTTLTLDLGGLRLGVLAFAENEFSTTTGPRPGAWPLDLVDNAAQIAAARREHDVVLVLFHGGVEEYPLPSPRMQKRCRFFVDMGADAVVCHHTHVVSGYEYYRGCPIVYGTGNFLFDCPEVPTSDWFTGYVAQIRVGLQAPLQLELVPYRQDPVSPTVHLMDGPERVAFFSVLDELNRVIADPDQLRANWSNFCRAQRSQFLGSLLCLSRPEAWLFDKKLLPTAGLRLTDQKLARLRNLFSCESHSEACEQILRDMLDETGRST